VPIPTDQQQSSISATTLHCDAHIFNEPWNYAMDGIEMWTGSFNVTELLQDPVPYSIYTLQPFCASPMFSADRDSTACCTELPYSPVIVAPIQVLTTLDPAWASCSLDLRGMYDQPRSLTPTSALDGPTTPAAAQPTVSATPASGPAKVTLVATSTRPPAVQSQATGGGIAASPSKP
jgi:hypothetical protein